MSFSAKPLTKTSTLGERLRELREESRLTIAQAAKETGVSAHHLEALEAGQYERLPGDIYSKNFVRRYARWLHLNEERVVEAYEQERSVLRPTEQRLPQQRGLPASITVTLVAKRTLITLLIVGILLYLGWEVGKIFAPPTLIVESPAASGMTHESTIEVFGRTDPEAAVVINGQSVFVNEDGQFRESVDLTIGRNTIEVSAVKKRGKETTVVREVVREADGE